MSPFNLPNRPSQPIAPFNRLPLPRSPPLAPGWTEHKAPTGHSYYYNAATKTSTYTRPVAPAPIPTPFAVGPAPNSYPSYTLTHGQYGGGGFPLQQFPNRQQFPPQQQLNYSQGRGRGRGGLDRGGRFNYQNSRPQYQKRQKSPDRPKSKRTVPGATPWILVTTKLGRKFVHNPETKISLWEAPDDVQVAMDAMPPQDETTKELRVKETKVVTMLENEDIQKGNESEYRGTKRPPSITTQIKGGKIESVRVQGEGEGEGEEEEEEEEEEGGDDDEEDDDDDDDDREVGHENKRLKTREVALSGPVEFTEDDIAWQLEAMAENYGLDEDFEEDEEMAEEDNISLFKEMLNDHKINPYSAWDTEMPRIVEDTRYVLITTTRRRKEIFTEWCRDHIAELKTEKEKIKKVDPKIAFWAFLKENASTKLYWPEFKRKWKKAPEMKDTKLIDKEKEKMYRDYITHIKTSESIREDYLKKLLKSTSGMCRSTPLDDLPESILIDVRYVTVPEKIRDAVIKDHLATLPEAPMNEEKNKARDERGRKERALRDRETSVRKEQWRLRGEEQRAKDMLREEEAMIERAKIVGKKGLLGHIIKKEDEIEGRKEEMQKFNEGDKSGSPSGRI